MWRAGGAAVLTAWLGSCQGHGTGGVDSAGDSGGGVSSPATGGARGGTGVPGGGAGQGGGAGRGTLPPAQGRDAGTTDAGPAQHEPRDAAADSHPAVAPDSSDFTTYLANPAHTGFVDDDTLVPPLRRLWTASLDASPAAYPLVVGDLVYTTTAGTDTTPPRVFALDRLTGARVWSASLGTSATTGLAYDNGRVFAVDAGGLVDNGTVTAPPVLRAFDAATGALDWQFQGSADQPFHPGPPIALNGTLYTTAVAPAGTATLFAYDEASAQVQWTGAFSNGAFAVSADGAFAFDGCGNSTALSLDGATKWRPTTDGGPCYPPGTSVVADHTLYQTTGRVPNARVDTRTGANLGTFAGDGYTPAFGHGLEVDVVGNTLQAISTATGAPAWTFTPEGTLATSALIAGGTVLAASQIGTLYAIDAATGKVAWSENVGTGFSLGFTMAAARGVLVVPVGNDLVAYGPAGPGFDAGVHDDGGQPSCPWTLVHDSPAPGVPGLQGVAIADFNKDGKRDLALASRDPVGGGGVTVFLGAGDGTFRGLIELSSFGEGTTSLAAADLDGDGVPDIVSASVTDAEDGNPNLKVSLSKGDGTLKLPTNYSIAMEPSGMVLADLDGSGRPDLVLADAADGFRVLLNQGKGTFGNPVAYASGQGALSIALADMNGDGKPDVVLGVNDPQNTIQVFPGKGNGTFGAPLTTAVDGWPTALAVGDVNGDGKLDVVLPMGDVEILIGKGDGTFAPATTMPAGGSASGVALGDLDLDGHADMVVTEQTLTSSDSVRIYFGNGDGTFQGTDTFATGSFPARPVITDLDGDGRPDIVTCDSGSTTLLLGACGTHP